MTRRLLALGASLLALSSPAFAADNFVVKDGSGADVTMRSKDTGSGVQAPMNTIGNSSGTMIDPATSTKQPALGTAGSPSTDVISVQGVTSGTPLNVALAADTDVIGDVGSAVHVCSGAFNRPADSVDYTNGDLVANSTTAGSVTPVSCTSATRASAGTATLTKTRLKKSSTTLTGASFRVHWYGASPTVTNGDNGVWLSTWSSYICAMDITMGRAFSDAAYGQGIPVEGSSCTFKLASGTTIYAQVEARATYDPTSAETFTIEAEILY